jgi:hypothetical protein
MVNVGVNDFSLSLTSGEWIGYMQTIIDAIHTKWPRALIYVAKPWSRGFDATADTFAGWVDTLVASRSSFASVGTDERVWLKGSDNGTTMTTDGTHYSVPTGQAENAAQWRTVLGY